MANSADKVVVLVDSSKFAVRSLMSVIPFEDIDIIVTDGNAPEATVKEIRDIGVNVIVAGAE